MGQPVNHQHSRCVRSTRHATQTKTSKKATVPLEKEAAPKAVSQLPKSSEENKSAPHTLSSLISATPLPASNCPTQSYSIPTLISNYLPTSSLSYHCSVQSSDHIKSALEAFDLLIAPQIIHPPNSTQSCITLRRFL